MEGNTDNSALWASMLNNGSQWMNNPWIYFVFLALFGRNGGLFGNGNGVADASLAQQVQDNHNTDLLMSAIKGNSDAAASLANQLNCDVNSINSAINAFRSSSDLGMANLASTFQNCCCENKAETMKMGYENQIGNLQQTNSLLGRIDQLANGIAQGFSSTAYANQAQTCELKTNQNENTQRIIDTMNNHWAADLQQRYNDVRLEMSQLKQNETLIAALKA